MSHFFPLGFTPLPRQPNPTNKKISSGIAGYQTADKPHYFGGVLSFERPQVAIAIFFPFTLPALSATACGL
ncbi:hypothetical protein ACKFBL_20925, partial [Yersinia enterocolitica]